MDEHIPITNAPSFRARSEAALDLQRAKQRHPAGRDLPADRLPKAEFLSGVWDSDGLVIAYHADDHWQTLRLDKRACEDLLYLLGMSR